MSSSNGASEARPRRKRRRAYETVRDHTSNIFDKLGVWTRALVGRPRSMDRPLRIDPEGLST